VSKHRVDLNQGRPYAPWQSFLRSVLRGKLVAHHARYAIGTTNSEPIRSRLVTTPVWIAAAIAAVIVIKSATVSVAMAAYRQPE
jgi:hypothetical protein